MANDSANRHRRGAIADGSVEASAFECDVISHACLRELTDPTPPRRSNAFLHNGPLAGRLAREVARMNRLTARQVLKFL
jgi:hypothetical protein